MSGSGSTITIHGRLGERGRHAGAQRRAGGDQSAAEPRKKRPPREGRPDVGALHMHLTSTGRTPAVGRRQ